VTSTGRSNAYYTAHTAITTWYNQSPQYPLAQFDDEVKFVNFQHAS